MKIKKRNKIKILQLKNGIKLLFMLPVVLIFLSEIQWITSITIKTMANKLRMTLKILKNMGQEKEMIMIMMTRNLLKLLQLIMNKLLLVDHYININKLIIIQFRSDNRSHGI
jgi:hypothetical protein